MVQTWFSRGSVLVALCYTAGSALVQPERRALLSGSFFWFTLGSIGQDG